MEAPLYEQKRASSWDEVVGQDEAVRKIELLRRRGLAGRAFWIRGESGHGKTTIARLIADEVSAQFFTTELDAQDLRLETVREFEELCRYKPMWGEAHTFIVNEAHRLRMSCIARLLTVLEQPEVQRNSVWIFTSTATGQQQRFEEHVDADAFLSRTIEIELKTGKKVFDAFAKVAQKVAKEEGLDGRPLQEYKKLAQKCHGNLRNMYQRIEAGEMLHDA